MRDTVISQCVGFVSKHKCAGLLRLSALLGIVCGVSGCGSNQRPAEEDALSDGTARTEEARLIQGVRFLGEEWVQFSRTIPIAVEPPEPGTPCVMIVPGWRNRETSPESIGWLPPVSAYDACIADDEFKLCYPMESPGGGLFCRCVWKPLGEDKESTDSEQPNCSLMGRVTEQLGNIGGSDSFRFELDCHSLGACSEDAECEVVKFLDYGPEFRFPGVLNDPSAPRTPIAAYYYCTCGGALTMVEPSDEQFQPFP